MSSRPWWIAQLWVGAALLVGAIVYYALITALQPRIIGPSIPFVVTATYYAPGLALSFGINGLVMARRRLRTIRSAERALLVVEFTVVALLVGFAFVVDQHLLGSVALDLSLLLWIAVIPLAVAILIVEVVPATSSAPTEQAAPRR